MKVSKLKVTVTWSETEEKDQIGKKKKRKEKKLINEVLACILQKNLKCEKGKSGKNDKICQGRRIYSILSQPLPFQMNHPEIFCQKAH